MPLGPVGTSRPALAHRGDPSGLKISDTCSYKYTTSHWHMYNTISTPNRSFRVD